ncbi:MAG: hypothetical protein HC811_10915 [Flammeovirgaceae bacterium]|nr:hypothetical protein [Flammeovirgaceae bacterium]
MLKKIYDQLNKRDASNFTDLNLLYLQLGNEAYLRGDKTLGFEAYQHISGDQLLNSFQYKNFNFVNTYSLELTALAVAHLSADNHFDEAYNLINVFKKKSIALRYMAMQRSF